MKPLTTPKHEDFYHLMLLQIFCFHQQMLWYSQHQDVCHTLEQFHQTLHPTKIKRSYKLANLKLHYYTWIIIFIIIY